MLIAKLGSPLRWGTPEQVFPNTSFSTTGPTLEWMQANNAVPVIVPEYDADSQVLEKLRYPRVENDTVVLHQVREMTAEEYTARQQERLNWVSKQAQILLEQTDWTAVPSVSDTTQPIYLSNLTDFEDYRDALRAIAVNPTLDPDWPVQPTTQWTKN